jgi:predicted nucleotidyltransferase
VIRHGLLTPLQDEVLHRFFDDGQPSATSFVLTGGAALAGFYTQHRTTTDLDLFTFDDPSFAGAQHRLAALVHQQGWQMQLRSSSPAFIRAIIDNSRETLVVDLVRDHSPQLGHPPTTIDGVRLDPLQQIFVNKLTALVGREEIRDIVDVMVLETRGFVVEEHLRSAVAKDGGCTPATLAWLLDGWANKVPTGVIIGHDSDTITSYMRALAQRMRVQALP